MTKTGHQLQISLYTCISTTDRAGFFFVCSRTQQGHCQTLVPNQCVLLLDFKPFANVTSVHLVYCIHVRFGMLVKSAKRNFLVLDDFIDTYNHQHMATAMWFTTTKNKHSGISSERCSMRQKSCPCSLL